MNAAGLKRKYNLKEFEKYSVLMSVYNGDKAEYVRQAIDSMLSQTVKPDQFVIVIDGTVSDDIWDLLNAYKSLDAIEVVPLKENVGLGKALDEGLKYCRNSLVARMDADDISVPDRCEKQLGVFCSYPSVSIVSGTIAEFADDINNIVSYRRVPETHSDIRQRMRIRSGFNHSAVMYRKDDVILCGGYGDLRRKQDHDLFSRMLNNGCRGYNIQEVLVYFRADSSAIKRKKSWQNVSGYIKAQWQCYKRREVSIGDLLLIVCGELFFMLMPVRVVRGVTEKFLRG